ncbi:helix-turn-helix domain-containing protein [Sinomicrobium pectinilyticum]|nr:helix-turn-helix domain-containing protein [Sinomicrobium pectinilyticum]
MARYRILLFFLFLFAEKAGSQQQDAFDSIYYHLYTANKDLDYGIRTADSLYRASDGELRKVKSLLLLSGLYRRKKDKNRSLEYLLEGERLASEAGFHEWQARACGALSSQYREAGLAEVGIRYLEKGIRVSRKIKQEEISNEYQGLLHQEKAYYAIAENNFRKAVQLEHKAGTYFTLLKDEFRRNLHLATTQKALGENYYRLHKNDSARYHYHKALNFIAGTRGVPIQEGMIHLGLGNIFMEENDFARASEHLQKALGFADASGDVSLQGKVYRALSHYYQAVEDIKNYTLYNDRYLEVVNREMEARQETYSRAVSQVYKEQAKTSQVHYGIIAIVSLLLLLAVIFTLVYRRRQREKHRKFWKILREVRKGNSMPPAYTETKGNSARETEMMPERTEKSLLNKLTRFEESGKFTDRNISSSALAARIGTNTKYLSYIINKYKEKDFNTYINELRIYHIVKKMEETPDYLNYKISYLAKECGFSSHSKFSTVFRNVIGMPPSEFMAYLRKKKKAV